MTDVFKAPFGTYAAAGGVITQTAKDAITAYCTELKRLIGLSSTNADNGLGAAHPDFDQIPPATRLKIAKELDAINALTEAAAEA